MTTIYEAVNHILIHTGYRDPACHRHMAAQIILMMEGKMEVTLEDGTFICHGVMIPSGVRHRIQTQGSAALVFLYDNTTGISARIREVRCLSEEVCNEAAQLYASFDRKERTYSDFHQAFLERIGMDDGKNAVTDSRILDAMAYIRTHLAEPLTCGEVAERVCLSQSRFSHLFRQETGMTFVSYLICQRILWVYALRYRGLSLTEAAHGAGFSGSAHFADVNRRVFGLSASEITRDWVFKKAEI